jgi:hypothetical protein
MERSKREMTETIAGARGRAAHGECAAESVARPDSPTPQLVLLCVPDAIAEVAEETPLGPDRKT